MERDAQEESASLPRLTRAGERVMQIAAQESIELDHHYLGVEHVFLGLAEEMKSDLGKAFRAVDADLPTFIKRLRGNIKASPRLSSEELLLTPRVQDVFDISARIATSGGGNEVGPPQLLKAVLREGRSVPMRLLRGLGVDARALAQKLKPDARPAPRSTPQTIRGVFEDDLRAFFGDPGDPSLK